MSTECIEKTIVLQAPRSRVWRALAHADEFGAWFGVTLEGTFTPGTQITARFTAPGHEQVAMGMTVERVEPEHLLAYRWHPYAFDPDADYTQEPTTLVEFRLTDVAGGTQLTVVESGFDRIPLARRALAFSMNDHGWTAQLANIATYVAP